MTKWLRAAALGLVAAAALTTAATTARSADDYPSRPVNLIVPFGVGGSNDRLARGLAQFMPQELGQPVTVVNRKGAGGQLGTTFMLTQPADGYTLLAHSISPYIANSIIHAGADYTLDDFAFINGQWTDFDIIAVNKDRPFQTLEEFIEAVRANPAEYSAAVMSSSTGLMTAHFLLEAAGLPSDALNIVTYESGGAARSAVAGGQVDLIIIGGEGSEGMREMIRPLAVVRETAAEGWDAPPVNDALAELGMEIPVLNGSIRGLAAPAAFRDKYPERWNTLISAYERTMKNPEFIAYLKKNDIGADWLGPEKTTEAVKRDYEVLERHKEILQR